MNTMKKIGVVLLALSALGLSACQAKPADSAIDSSSSGDVHYVEQSVILPRSTEEILQKNPFVITVEVRDKEVRSEPDLLDENGELAEGGMMRNISYLTVTIKDVLHGDMQKGQTITVCQHGDGVDWIYDYVEQAGGYMKIGEQYLLLLHPFKDVYYPNRLAGQCKIDEQGRILAHSDFFGEYFSGIETVEDMRNRVEEWENSPTSKAVTTTTTTAAVTEASETTGTTVDTTRHNTTTTTA